jgi:hypothetical protein
LCGIGGSYVGAATEAGRRAARRYGRSRQASRPPLRKKPAGEPPAATEEPSGPAFFLILQGAGFSFSDNNPALPRIVLMDVAGSLGIGVIASLRVGAKEAVGFLQVPMTSTPTPATVLSGPAQAPR